MFAYKKNLQELPVSPSSTELICNIEKFGAKKYVTDHRIASFLLLFILIQLFIALKGNFSGLFFF